MPLLIPGVGAQGGSLEQAAKYGTDGFVKPAVINVSRSVLYASKDQDFAAKARAELIKLNSAVSRIKGGGETPPSEQNQPEQEPTDTPQPDTLPPDISQTDAPPLPDVTSDSISNDNAPTSVIDHPSQPPEES